MTVDAAQRTSFVFVTGNPDKGEEARRILRRPLEVLAIDLPELQSATLREVLEHKADEAWRRLRRPLVVEETGLELVALNGFPGPLVKWMLAAVGPDGIAQTALALGESAVTARCALLLVSAEARIFAEGETHGRLVLPPRGERGFGWDPVFVPFGESLTYGELDPADKDRLGHRGRAWRRLLAELDGLLIS